MVSTQNATLPMTLELDSVNYHPQSSCGKVMFSQAFVILFMEVYPSMHWGRHPPGQTTPWADNTRSDTSRRPMQQTVRILLECILVIQYVKYFKLKNYSACCSTVWFITSSFY